MGYEIIWEPRGVVKRLFGQVSSDDLIKSSTIVQGDERFDDLRYVIIDFMDCTSHSVSDPALLEIAAIDEAAMQNRDIRLIKKIFVAIVANDLKILALAQKYANYDADVVRFGIFLKRSDARAWLDMSVDHH